MTFPVRLVSVGIGKESTYGTPVAPAGWLPVTRVAPADDLDWQTDQSWRGVPAVSHAHAVSGTAGKVSLGGPVFADTVGYPLAGVLGDLGFTGGTPNTHTVALLTSGTQQPASHTVLVNDPIQPLRFAGCKWSTVTLSFDSSSVLSWTGEIQSQPPSTTTLVAPAPTAVSVIPGWRGLCQIGGVSEPRLLAGQVTIDRALEAKRNTDGSLTPWYVRSDEVAVSGKLTVVAAAANAETYRLAAAQGTVTSVDLNWQQGAGAGAQQVRVHCSNVTLTAAERDYGQKWVVVELEFEADTNATDVGASGGRGPVKVTLQNTVGSGIYG